VSADRAIIAGGEWYMPLAGRVTNTPPIDTRLAVGKLAV